MEQPNYSKQLLLQLNQQRSRGYLCDVIIVVENALFRAHKNILAACSSYFKCLVLQNNLIALNTTMVKPSVFKQVLDFIYTGQLPASLHVSNQGVCDLLRAASYLQLSDLAALCRRKLKPCRSSNWRSSTSTTNGHSYHSGPAEEVQQGELQGEDLRLKLIRKSPTGSSPRSSSNSSDETRFNSTSAFYKPRSEHTEKWYKRPRSSNVWTKREEVRSGELVQAEGKVSEDQTEVREEDLSLKFELQKSEGSEDEELNGNIGYVYHQPQPRGQPALHSSLYMCIPCGRGFPSSEQLIAHVDSHTAEGMRAEEAEEGGVIKTEDQDSENLPSEETKAEETPPHERSHRLTRPFSCDVCGKMFTQRGTMTRHMRSHLGLKPFACEECGMRFTRQYRKMEHMRIHSRDKTAVS